MPELRDCLLAVTLTGALVLCCSTPARGAQTNTGDISGVVRDTQGGVLPGSTVVAEHVDSRTTITRVADARGRYHLPSLRVGAYVNHRRACGLPARRAVGRHCAARPDGAA